MRILLIYYEPRPSGQTRHVLSLVQGLNRRHSLTVVLPQTLESCIAAFEQAGARAIALPLGKVAWSPMTLAQLGRLIRGEAIEIVHVHSQEAGIPGRIVARLSGAGCVVYTPQTIDIRRRNWFWLYVWLERALAHLTDAIVSVNESDRARLAQWGIPPRKVVTIPNGVDLGEFEKPVQRQDLCCRWGLDADRPLVLQIGRLNAQKDPMVLVKGAARLLQSRPEVQFALVGEGPLRGELAACIESMGLGKQVRLLGEVAGASRLMPAADLVTLTSRWEGAPYALLEAMGWSRPVVATAVNGCPEIVEDGVTGILVPPGDPAAWARAVAVLLDNPDRATTMGRRGRERLEERFLLQQMIDRVEGLYLSCTRRL